MFENQIEQARLTFCVKLSHRARVHHTGKATGIPCSGNTLQIAHFSRLVCYRLKRQILICRYLIPDLTTIAGTHKATCIANGICVCFSSGLNAHTGLISIHTRGIDDRNKGFHQAQTIGNGNPCKADFADISHRSGVHFSGKTARTTVGRYQLHILSIGIGNNACLHTAHIAASSPAIRNACAIVLGLCCHGIAVNVFSNVSIGCIGQFCSIYTAGTHCLDPCIPSLLI